MVMLEKETKSCVKSSGVSIVMLTFSLMFVFAAVQVGQSQDFGVVWDFSGGSDGASPYSLLTVDQGGNLYGTTFLSGAGNGTVFKLNREGDGWIFTTLYQFKGGNDGSGPYHGGVVFGPDGSLYGTTAAGGGTGGACANFADEYVGCGVVYNLRPSISFCRSVLCPWTETVLYRFQGHEDGSAPFGNLVFDGSGNLYGVTYYGGPNSTGTVYKLSLSSGGWTKTTIYTFSGGSDGASPADGLTMDVFGNLYGTTLFGGAFGGGTVFMLTPSGGAWSKTILYNFTGGDDGANPYAAVVFDRSGNLYGTTESGSAFELTPGVGGWSFNTLQDFGGYVDGGPHGQVAIDAAGNVYGTTTNDNHDHTGTLWLLEPTSSGWEYSQLYDFANGANGANPLNGMALGPDTVLYGTTSSGGSHGRGVVFEYAPFGFGSERSVK